MSLVLHGKFVELLHLTGCKRTCFQIQASAYQAERTPRTKFMQRSNGELISADQRLWCDSCGHYGEPQDFGLSDEDYAELRGMVLNDPPENLWNGLSYNGKYGVKAQLMRKGKRIYLGTSTDTRVIRAIRDKFLQDEAASWV